MSIRNGDKARFGKLRRQTILLRKRMREMWDTMKTKPQGQPLPRANDPGPVQ